MAAKPCKNLNFLRVDIIREATNEGRPSRKRKLQVAFSQRQLRCLAFADVDRHVYDTHYRARLISCKRIVADAASEVAFRPKAQSEPK